MGEFSFPSVIVSIDDRVNTYKPSSEGVSGLKDGFGLGNGDGIRLPIEIKSGFGITGVGGGVVRPGLSERTRMTSDGGLTIDSASSASSSDDEDSDGESLPSSDDDSGFGLRTLRSAIGQVANGSKGGSNAATALSGIAEPHQVVVPVKFTVPLTASLSIVWEAFLSGKSLVVPRLPNDGNSGSKESLIQLLEFAEDQLGCESVFICLPKVVSGPGTRGIASPGGTSGATSHLARMFAFLGFTVVANDHHGVDSLPAVFQTMPGLLEGTIMQYEIGDEDIF